ncbi:hypothetical protein J1614_009293 [Plenodomus biglobosus]|nr:hypothetical protein J1614_009293 [Plenodomus biglobosus]
MEALNKSALQQSAWTEKIQGRLHLAYQLIAEKWHEVHASTVSNIDTSGLQNLQPDRDIATILRSLDEYISQIAARKSTPRSCTFLPTSEYPTFSADELPMDLSEPSQETFFRLAAMEKWTEEHLETWVEKNSKETDVCDDLRRLMEHYHCIASDAYADTPLNLSIM